MTSDDQRERNDGAVPERSCELRNKRSCQVNESTYTQSMICHSMSGRKAKTMIMARHMLQTMKQNRNRLKMAGSSVKMVRFVDSLTVAAHVML